MNRTLKTLLTLSAALCLLGTQVLTPAMAAKTVVYIHNDVGGSPIAATDANGNVLWQENYRPYGERLNNEPTAADNRQWFHGKPQDVSGLQYFGARYYDPTLGRFMGVDPQAFTEDNVHSFNRYAYGNDNPYKYVDPDGRAAIFIPLLIVGGAIIIGGGYHAQQSSLAANAGLVPPKVHAGTPGFAAGAWSGFTEALRDPGGFVTWSGEKLDGLIFNNDVTKRPSRVRKGTEEANWEDAANGGNGGKLCPTCGSEVHSRPGEKNKDWDNDHEPAWRLRDPQGMDRKEVLNDYNRDTRLRCVNCNRSDNGR